MLMETFYGSRTSVGVHCSSLFCLSFRCRWAQNTSTLDECGDICGVVPGSVLKNNSCTLTFTSTGMTVGNFYAVALTIEDFANASSTTPLSSVPVQFLVEIVSSPSCLSKTTIASNVTAGTRVLRGYPFQFTLFIQTHCPGVTISNLFRMSPLEMYKSDLTYDNTTNTSMITENWTPTTDQVGPQMYCAVAMDRYSSETSVNF